MTIPLPDLLALEPRPQHDQRAVFELLDLAFLGREVAVELDRHLAGAVTPTFDAELFAQDLFLDDLVASHFVLEIWGRRYTPHRPLLLRILSAPPGSAAAVAFRQGILRELDESAPLLAAVEGLYLELGKLISMLKAPEHAAQLDAISHRLDVLESAKAAIDRMATAFVGAGSGLVRLAEAGRAIQATDEYGVLAAVLDYESRLATLRLEVDVGAEGRLRRVDIVGVTENHENRFHQGPLRRWAQRLSGLLRVGSLPSNRDLFGKLLHRVFTDLAPALTPLVSIAGQLELYLGSRGFRHRCQRAGLVTSLADFSSDGPLRLERLFNPHLLVSSERPPVPTDVAALHRDTTMVLTGPNSGGKTRLLQAIGLAQLLGQSGLYVPAAAADLRVVKGMFVSLVERETLDQSEGRLGRELMRIRRLFESMGSPSMVILDELCSGTNPEEGVEIFDLVLRLLDRLGSVALVSTHFLAYARRLAEERPIASLQLIQAEVDSNHRPTYHFVPGVATTSLAAATAARLGVGFDELARLVDERRG